MRIYLENFRPSRFLDEPYSLVSVGAVADEDPAEARRQSSSTAMAMLRMFQRKPFSLLPPEEVEAFHGTYQERQIIEEYTDRALHGTAAEVASGLEELHHQTGMDEVMLVAQGYSRRAQARTVELIAHHYGMPTGTTAAWLDALEARQALEKSDLGSWAMAGTARRAVAWTFLPAQQWLGSIQVIHG